MSCPSGKVPFASAAEARSYSRGDRGTLHAYRCNACGQYHQTTKSKTAYRRLRLHHTQRRTEYP